MKRILFYSVLAFGLVVSVSTSVRAQELPKAEAILDRENAPAGLACDHQNFVSRNPVCPPRMRAGAFVLDETLDASDSILDNILQRLPP